MSTRADLVSNTNQSDGPTRRDFITLVASASSLALVPNPLRNLLRTQRPETTFRWEAVTPASRVAYGSGGNSLVVVRGKEALLVDTKVLAFGQVLAREIRSFGATVSSVINTHHHSDHTGGNDAFTPSANVVAQTRAKDRAVASARASLPRLAGASVDAYAA